MLKKLLVLPFALATVVSFGSLANAAEKSSSSAVSSSNYSAASTTAPQFRDRNGRGRRALVSFQTRNVRVGRRVYRETYRVTQRPNGRVITQLVNRTQIR
jgi:ubiquinone/menaquinone biosynthesis C-methylase UbiE